MPVDDPDRYEYAGEHGRGGLGRVVRAVDARLGRTVAIKELLKTSELGEALFVREALITARLQHPGIVPVHEAGRWPSGEPYYVMKLVSGRPLKELIAESASLEDRLGLLPNVIAVAEALAYAHSEQVIHRDIKPANVVVGEFGETIVVDWGLARDGKQNLEEPSVGGAAAPSSSGSGPRSVSGKVIGTPQYMPPEQARGEPVDARADVYALGALLYEVLAGKAPYAGEAASQVIERVLAGAPVSLARLAPRAPRELLAIVDKAMARAPLERYPTARELAEDLRRFQRGQLVLAHDYSTVSLLRRWMARHRALVAAGLAVLLTGGVLGAIAISRVVQERNRANDERTAATLAQQAAEERGADLLLLQAESALREDPTAAVAWLKAYPHPERHLDRRLAIADEARSRGVAAHVFEHEAWVLAAAFTDGDRQLATASNDGKLRLWDLATGEARVVLHADGKFPALAIRRDGKALAMLGAEGTLAVVDLETGTHLEHELGVRGELMNLRFDGDGTGIIATVDSSVFRAQLDTGEVTLKSSADGYAGGAILADGKTLVRSRLDGTIERQTGDQVSIVATLAARAELIVPSPSEKAFIAWSSDGELTHVDIARGTTRALGKKAGVRRIEFSPDEARISVIGDDPVIVLWNLVSGTRSELRGHEDALYHAIFSPDGTRLASASDDGTARVWHLGTGDVQVLRGHRDDVFWVTFSSDGRWLATASLDGTTRVWPVGDGGHLLLGQHNTPVTGLVALDRERLATKSLDGEVRITDLASGNSRTIIPVIEGTSFSRWILGRSPALIDRGKILISAGEKEGFQLIDRHTEQIRASRTDLNKIRHGSASRDGTVIALAATDLRIDLYDEAMNSLGALELASPTRGVDVSLDGKRLVSAMDDGVTVWELPSRKLLAQLDPRTVGCQGPHAGRPMLSPSGRWLVVISKEGETMLWDLPSGAGRVIERGDASPISLEFSPDESFVVAGMNDRTVRIWPMNGGDEKVLHGHRDLILRVAMSPTGDRFASASYDKTLRVWTADGRTERILRGHSLSVETAVFSADGKTLYSGGRDGTIRAWDLSAPPLSTASELEASLQAVTTAQIHDDLPRTR